MQEDNKIRKTEEKSNGKYVLIFAVVMAAGFLVGGLCGALISKIKKSGIMENFGAGSGGVIMVAVPVIFILMNVVLFLISLFRFLKVKKQAALWDGEDEETIERIERGLSLPSVLPNIALIGNFALFAAVVQIAEFSGLPKKTSGILEGLNILVFLLGYVWSLAITKVTVDLEKKLNPEKRGNVFDMNFKKRWMESCDEAQLLMMYKCGFRAYKAVNSVCLALWVVLLLAQFLFEIGVVPVLCVCTIWMVSFVVYTVEASRLDR